jgi:hypothetical protein
MECHYLKKNSGTKSIFHSLLILCTGDLIMDKATKTQFSIAFFVIGFIMMILQVLKYLDTIVTGISGYFPIMFYLGLICMAIGYYLK